MNARQLIRRQYIKLDLSSSFKQCLFGLDSPQGPKDAALVKSKAQAHELSFQNIKTYNLVKKVIWGCVLDDPSSTPKSKQ